MDAIILCGGLGTRIRNLFPNVPKTLIPINGYPFLFYLLNQLHQSPISNIILSTFYKSEQVEEFLKKNEKKFSFSLKILKESSPLGTGGAIKNCINTFNIGNDFLVLNGDTYFPIPLNQIIESHFRKNAMATLSLKRIVSKKIFSTFSLSSQNVIKNIISKEPHSDLIHAGVTLVNKSLFQRTTLREFHFEQDLLFPLIHNKEIIYGEAFDHFFVDIGTPEGFKRAEKFFKEEYLWKKFS